MTRWELYYRSFLVGTVSCFSKNNSQVCLPSYFSQERCQYCGGGGYFLCGCSQRIYSLKTFLLSNYFRTARFRKIKRTKRHNFQQVSSDKSEKKKYTSIISEINYENERKKIHTKGWKEKFKRLMTGNLAYKKKAKEKL